MRGKMRPPGSYFWVRGHGVVVWGAKLVAYAIRYGLGQWCLPTATPLPDVKYAPKDRFKPFAAVCLDIALSTELWDRDPAEMFQPSCQAWPTPRDGVQGFSWVDCPISVRPTPNFWTPGVLNFCGWRLVPDNSTVGMML